MGKKKTIPEWIKWERQARRLVELEEKTNKVHSTVELSHKKDHFDRESNTVRPGDYFNEHD